MCLQNMDNQETNKRTVSKNMLDLFWNLTNNDSEQRIKTCISILRSLYKNNDQASQSDDMSTDLKYCTERLVKGLASSRDAARLGYSLLLTEVLKQFSTVQVEDVLELIKQHLSFTPKQEKRDVIFGQLFAFSSIIRSGRVANHSHLSFVILNIYDLWQGRNFILNACYEIIKNLFDQLSSEKFAEEVWPHLKKKFTDGWEKCSTDNLWLLFLIMRLFPEVVSERYLKKNFNCTNIFASENFEHLKKLIKQTSSCLPNFHPLCSEISIVCGSHKDMKEVWNSLVDRNLFEESESEKFFVGLEMVKSTLKVTKKKKIIKQILSSKISSIFTRSYINPKSAMNTACVNLADFLSKYAIESNDPEIEMIIVKFFLKQPSEVSLGQLLKKKEISFLIQNLLPETIKRYSEFLMEIVFKEEQNKDSSGDHTSENNKLVAVVQVGALVSHAKIVSEMEWRVSIIKFLFLHSFFSIKEPSSEILHSEQHVEEISDNLRKNFVNAFFKTLTALYHRTDQQTPMQHSLQCLMMLMEYADQLLAASNNITPHFPHEKVQEAWIQLTNTVHKLKKQSKKDGKVNESNAFLSLFLELGFHLFHDFEHISGVLEELQICCKKALSNRRHSTEQSADSNEPPWVGVVIDIMLSLLSRSSQHLRRIVSFVFQLLCPFITQEALQQILSVINPEKDSENAMLVDDSDEENEELNFESGSSDESDTNEADESKVDEKFREKVKEALGSAADESDAESVILSDSEMFKLDDALAKAFKERLQTGHTQMKSEDKAMLEFRLRCLDLILIYFKSDPPMNLALYCVEPLLAAYEFSHRNEQQKHYLQKIVSTIEGLVRIKKFENIDNVEKSELKKLLEILIAKCHKEVNLHIAKKLYSLCVFVVLCFRRLENKKSDKKSKRPSYLKPYLSALDEFAKGSNSHIYPQFFVTLMESCPDLAWYIIDSCKNYAYNEEVRMYRKTQCLGLLFEAIKFAKGQETISNSEWSDLCQTLIHVTAQTLKKILQESDLKPVYLTELLDVLYTCHTIMKEKTNQSILENYSDLVPYLCNPSKNGKKKLGKKGKMTWRKIVLCLGGNVATVEENSVNISEEDQLEEITGETEQLTNVDSSPKKRKSPSNENKKKKRKTVSSESSN